MPDGVREQLFLVHVACDDVDLGIWDKWDGGDKGTENVQYRSGGEELQENLGGGTTISAITVSRNYRLSRDRPIVGFLLDRVSKGLIVATKQPLDRSYVTYGDPIQAIGLLTEFQDPKVDSNSNNPAMLSIIIQPNSLTG